MNTEVRNLEPKEIWRNFADLNAVPRPSKKEEQVIQFIMDFGRSLGLETIKDAVGNVVIRKGATSGMENRKTVTLQSHLDMVHQKNADTDFDFGSQGIQMYIDGDWVRAQGTTLGADNGIGVATIMALLKSTQIAHPPLEALFTIDEETGMTGAMGLEAGVLQGEILLNLDTEEDDEIDIGCAGGIDVTAKGTYAEESPSSSALGFLIRVKGLRGGHSGVDIHKGLGNANKLMNRLLYNAARSFGIQVAEIEGGSLRNAIPRESRALITVEKGKAENCEREFTEWASILKKELSITEPKLIIELKPADLPLKVMESLAQGKLLRSIYAAHNGVYAMSAAIPNLVETSNNVARIEARRGSILIGCLTRSSVDSAKMDLANALSSVFELADYKVEFSGNYPGWNPNPDSEMLKIMKGKYVALFREDPKVVACHAGLECGILGRNYPEMDMISFGPTILGAHSPDERVRISSVQKFWGYLLEVLKAIPLKKEEGV